MGDKSGYLLIFTKSQEDLKWKNDGKATYIANLEFFVPKDPLFNHCALPPYTKQLTFVHFFHLSIKHFKKCFENGLKGVNQLGSPFFF